jgi:hypothetical protein
LKSRKIPLIFALALALVLTLLSGCRDTLPCDYRDSPFLAEIRYACGKDTFCAEVTVGAPPSDTLAERDIEIRFTSPMSLAGLCAERKNGISKVTLGSADVKSEAAAEALLRAAELMIFEGELKFIEKYEENGLLFYRAEISGERGTLKLLTDSQGYPKKLYFGDTEITVVRMR